MNRAELGTDFDLYAMSLAEAAAVRSKCLRRQVGAVLALHGRFVATGYNGPPSGIEHCQTCRRDVSGADLCFCRAIHAEENVIMQAAMYGPSTVGATMYCTLQPCFHCCLMIAQAKIKEVVYKKSYNDRIGLRVLESAGVVLRQL